MRIALIAFVLSLATRPLTAWCTLCGCPPSSSPPDVRPVAEVSPLPVHPGDELAVRVSIAGSGCGTLSPRSLEIDFPRELQIVSSIHKYADCRGVVPGVPPIRCTPDSREGSPTITLRLRVPQTMTAGFTMTARVLGTGPDAEPANDTLVIPVPTFTRRGHRVVRRSGPFLYSSILWIGAHPDDELFIAPFLGDACRERGVRCHLLVATRGERGECLLPGGCNPDLETVRSEEMKNAAALFNASLTQGDFPDASATTVSGVIEEWSNKAGGKDRLLDIIDRQIRNANVEAVITFDPDHGSTGHVDHRAVGELVREVIDRLQLAPTLFFVETRLTATRSAFGLDLSLAPQPGEAVTLTYDANAVLPHIAESSWKYVYWDALMHTSQYAIEWLRALENVRPAERRVYLFEVPR